MAITPIQKIFAYNIGALVFGTTQVGDIAISDIDVEYSANYGGLQWWGGPDETNGYVIAYPVPGCDRNTPVGIQACLGFKRSTSLTNNSFIELANSFVGGPPAPFSSATDASEYLTNNGYWNSYPVSGVTPTPTATLGLTPTPTITPTSTSAGVTPTPSVTSSVTPTPTGTASVTPTPTPTPTSGATGDFTVTVSQVGPDVVWNGSGKFNLAALTSAGTNNIGGGFQANQAIWAIGPNVAVDTYSGTITYPTSFGAGGTPVTSNTGSTFGILPGGSGRLLYVPSGYTSNTTISGSSTYANNTIAGMGLSAGTYTWSWGSGGNASTLVMTITP
jgi:hypothetical protein